MATTSVYATPTPILLSLPVSWQDPDISPLTTSVTAYWDSEYNKVVSKLLDLYRQVDPATCDPEWLDLLAVMFGWTALYWNKSWGIQIKRDLLTSTYDGELVAVTGERVQGGIFATKGSLATLSVVLALAGHPNNVVVEGDFLVGINEVGDAIGVQPWEYTLYLPPSYQASPKLNEVLLLVSLFQPAWVKRNLVFSADRFVTVYALADQDGNYLVDGTGEGFEIDRIEQ